MNNVAIIMPVYNTQDYIKRSIESILSSINIDLKLYIIDDGSTDNSSYISQYYQKIDKRIIYIKKNNEGQGIARNIGIKLADAEYLYFVDSDDYIDKETLSILYKTAKKYDLDLCSPNIPKKYFEKPFSMISCLPCKAHFINSFIIKKFNIYQPTARSGQDGVFSHLVMTHSNKIGMAKNAIFHYTNKRCGSTFEKYAKLPHEMFSIICNHYDAIVSHYDKYNLWESNATRLIDFIVNETLLNRINLHFYKLTDDEKKYSFNLIKCYLNRCSNFVKDKEIEPYNKKILNLFQEKISIDNLINIYENKYIKLGINHEYIYSNYEDLNVIISKDNTKEITMDSKHKIYDMKSNTILNDLIEANKYALSKIDLSIQTINNSTYKILNSILSSDNHFGEINNDIIVSMTTVQHRLDLLYAAIISIIEQNIRPFKIVVWIPENIVDIPSRLNNFVKFGLEINRVKDIGPHTKLIYALKKFCNKKIITIDDDIIYPENMIKTMLNVNHLYPNAIVANWARELTFDSNGKVKEIRAGKLITPPTLERTIEPNFLNQIEPNILYFPYGTSGVLYPKNSFGTIVFNLDLMKKLCPTEDDIWFKATSMLNGTKVAVTTLGINPKHHCITGSQIDALRYINHGKKRNYEQLVKSFDELGIYNILKKFAN